MKQNSKSVDHKYHPLKQDFSEIEEVLKENRDQIIQQALSIDNISQRYDFIKDKFKDDNDGLSFAIGALGLFY